MTAFLPIIFDFPTSFPSASFKDIPSEISLLLIIITLAHPADPTAKKLIKKFMNRPLVPEKYDEKGLRSFFVPKPIDIEAPTAPR